MPHPAAVSVAVLVELERGPHSGGHVKCWERLAAAAAGRDDLDLTVYCLGRTRAVEAVAPNVRFVTLRPVLSSRRAGALVGGVDPSDLAPYHPALAQRLHRHDVWHLTHAMAFGATAARLARRNGGHRLVGSVHTDVPVLTGHYVGQVLDRLPHVAGRLLNGLAVEDRAVQAARRTRDRVFGACSRILVSSTADRRDLGAVLGPERIGWLRRGVDAALFHPDRADRGALALRYGIPDDRQVVVFAGRLDATKGVMTVAKALRRMLDDGSPAHLVLAGSGADCARITDLLGCNVTALGTVSQPELARVFASADVLAFPSHSETAGNVVIEAMACGLPVLLPQGAQTARWLRTPGRDGVLVTDDHPEGWQRCLTALLAQPRLRAEIGRLARQTASRHNPTWDRVLEEDLLPVWAARKPATPTLSPTGTCHRARLGPRFGTERAVT